jgi:hypothetical protein
MTEFLDGVCPNCGTRAPLSQETCWNGCGLNLVPFVESPQWTYVAAPDPVEPVRPDRPRSPCWYCGTESPDPGNDRCLNPQCLRTLVPPALAIMFEQGPVALYRGQTVGVGRVGEYAQVFRRYPNVSRHHVVVGVDLDGGGWIQPNPDAINGTFLDGEEIVHRRPLAAGQQVRFAAAETGPVGRVRQPDRESPTASLTRLVP